jgi:hypothetical protein
MRGCMLQTYTTKVSIINRSGSKAGLRLLEVDPMVANMFEASMPPPGFMAPGTSATVKLTFKPKVSGFHTLLISEHIYRKVTRIS